MLFEQPLQCNSSHFLPSSFNKLLTKPKILFSSLGLQGELFTYLHEVWLFLLMLLVLTELGIFFFFLLFFFLGYRRLTCQRQSTRGSWPPNNFPSSREEVSYPKFEPPTSSLRFGYFSTIIQYFRVILDAELCFENNVFELVTPLLEKRKFVFSSLHAERAEGVLQNFEFCSIFFWFICLFMYDMCCFRYI